jgi:hypothetical protein
VQQQFAAVTGFIVIYTKAVKTIKKINTPVILIRDLLLDIMLSFIFNIRVYLVCTMGMQGIFHLENIKKYSKK